MISNNLPSVVAVMLTRDRPEMTKRAIACFRRQTYRNCKLLIWDSSDAEYTYQAEYVIHVTPECNIGRLRNAANRQAVDMGADIIVHWDSDDWSHAERISEQVKLLMASDRKCVGYRDMLFWDTRESGEAWKYTNADPRAMVGSSMCYRREAWQACPFDEVDHAEDIRWWLKNAKMCTGVRSIRADEGDPRMVCAIHAGNTSTAYRRSEMDRAREWVRVPEHDKFCQEAMRL